MENVTVELGGRIAITLTDYSIRLGVFEQPSSFECTLAWPYEFRGLAEQFPPKTPYRLRFQDRLIQSGFTDGFSFSGSGTSTSIRLRGRDPIQKLVDTEIDADLSISEATFEQVTEFALEKSGLKAMLEKAGLPGPFLIASNEANRKAITGTRDVKELAPALTESEQTELGDVEATATVKKVKNTIRGEAGTTWWDFLVKQYRRIGMFLWCGADGTLILSRPKGNQPSIGRLFRKTGRDANITTGSFDNDTTRRHSECIVFGRGMGKKGGSGKDGGRFIDPEMVAYLNPLEKDRADGGVIKIVKTLRDSECKSQEQAQNLAKREIAEERRGGWKLSYVVAGHTIVGLAAEDTNRIALAPDIVVDVDDDDFGVYGPMYVEGVTLVGSPRSTTTQIDVLRIEDLFFENETPARKLKAKGIATQQVVNGNTFVGGILAEPLQETPWLTGWKYPSPDPFAQLPQTPEESFDHRARYDELRLKPKT